MAQSRWGMLKRSMEDSKRLGADEPVVETEDPFAKALVQEADKQGMIESLPAIQAEIDQQKEALQYAQAIAPQEEGPVVTDQSPPQREGPPPPPPAVEPAIEPEAAVAIEPQPQIPTISQVEQKVPESPLKPPETLEQERKRLFEESVAEQKAGIKGLEEAMSGLQKPSGMEEILPFLMASDALTGSKFTQLVKGMSPEERKLKIAQLGTLIQEERGKITKARLEDIQSQLKGTQKSAKAIADNKRKFFKEFSMNPQVKEANAALAEVGAAKEMLNSKTAVGEMAFRTKLARIVGEKGPLSNGDIAMYAGSQSVGDTFARMLEKYTTGRATAADKRELNKIIDILADAQRVNLKGQIERFATRVGPSVYDLDPEEAREMISSQEAEKPQLEAEPEKPARKKPILQGAKESQQGDEAAKKRARLEALRKKKMGQ